jgi:hypothetical protein
MELGYEGLEMPHVSRKTTLLPLSGKEPEDRSKQKKPPFHFKKASMRDADLCCFGNSVWYSRHARLFRKLLIIRPVVLAFEKENGMIEVRKEG